MAKDKVFVDKLARIRQGESPRVLDLFAGCGGISLGFHRAGYAIAGAIEIDPIAARSHAVNFFRDAPETLRERHAHAIDITQVEPEQFVCDLGIRGRPERAFDVIVGGPPCQAFARVGRAKLREVAEHPEAFKLDERSNLYLRYLRYVKVLRPLAILMENVPDVLNYGGHNIAEEVAETLDDLGYVSRYTLLNAVHYGVPEMRERMFLVAIHEAVQSGPVFPDPIAVHELPPGYENSRQVALRTVRESLFDEIHHFVETPRPNGRRLSPATTAAEAIGDLPPITAHLEGRLRRGTRRFDTHVPYRTDVPVSRYAQLMRSWPAFEGNGGVSDHVIRSLPRDYAIFRRMHPGDEYPAAYRHALALFEDALRVAAKRGRPIRPGTARYEALRKSIVPPYDPGKFPNKWRKMAPDEPARTLMAHLGKDSYSHIHYDSAQARTISVREAARLQSFPDGFTFCGTMNPAFRQIGNAVPPLLAYHIAHAMRTALGIVQ